MTDPDIKLEFRKAQEKDLMPLFILANDSLVRKNSFNSESIEINEHKKWFHQKLKDKDDIIIIAEESGNLVGMVRFEDKKELSIGVSIAPDYRGRGLGCKLITYGIQHLEKNNIHKDVTAYIKIENTASIRIFEKSGFKLEKMLTKEGQKAYKYVYRWQDKN